MPRHTLHPLPRAFAPRRSAADAESSRQALWQDDGVWGRMDRVQVLGTPGEGHRGCVNALSWSDDGSTLLSGSDDQRICIWTSDSSSSHPSPHPLKLVETIATGHQANIFSAKYLPNASTPTIVSCAGDRDVRVFEVERLGRADVGMRMGGREELWGIDGPGVRVLKCHTDRTKRIATENSPYLFLTVSEDGTVRQHDLRRPHRCRSECPEALFHAPRGVDLYSLSVSMVAPHMFAVAGRTDCAYVCDRRMLERQSPGWGPHVRSSGQVHCVRRLGLPEEEWGKVGARAGRSFLGEERHVTCVKMSPERADEVICAFAKHSTSLFSTYDSPGPSSIRSPSPSSVIPPNPKPKGRHRSRSSSTSSASASSSTSLNRQHAGNAEAARSAGERYAAGDFERTTRRPGKRRQSALSGVTPAGGPLSRQRTSESGGRYGEGVAEDADGEVRGVLADILSCGEVELDEDWDRIEETEDAVAEEVELDERGRGDEADPTSAEDVAEREQTDIPRSTPLRELLRRVPPTRPIDTVLQPGDLEDLDPEDLMPADDDDVDMDMNMDLELFDSDEEEEDEGEDEDEDVDYDAFGDEIGGMDAPRATEGEFADVEVVYPRKVFRGARNVETVKDCNFLGARSDKVCSGSDDGNFFVWDRDTGRLEGIWEGDAHVVNVMEQHPSLPLVAVSGIDHTVKMFAPVATRPNPSFCRTQLSERILRANTLRPGYQRPSAFGTVSLLDFLESRGIVARHGGGGGDGDEDDDDGNGEGVPQTCQTQ